MFNDYTETVGEREESERSNSQIRKFITHKFELRWNDLQKSAKEELMQGQAHSGSCFIDPLLDPPVVILSWTKIAKLHSVLLFIRPACVTVDQVYYTTRTPCMYTAHLTTVHYLICILFYDLALCLVFILRKLMAPFETVSWNGCAQPQCTVHEPGSIACKQSRFERISNKLWSIERALRIETVQL